MRWLADAGADGVVARTDSSQTARERRGGVALFVIGGTRFLKHPAYGPFDQTEDSGMIQVPQDGFRARLGRALLQRLRALLSEDAGARERASRRAGRSIAIHDSQPSSSETASA